MSKVTIEVEEDAIEVLDLMVKWVYELNLRDKQGHWGDDPDYDEITPERLMWHIKPIAKRFGLYPFNQPTNRMVTDDGLIAADWVIESQLAYKKFMKEVDELNAERVASTGNKLTDEELDVIRKEFLKSRRVNHHPPKMPREEDTE
jgi:hypothetical protein